RGRPASGAGDHRQRDEKGYREPAGDRRPMSYVDRSELREHLSHLVVHEGGKNDEPEVPWLHPFVWRPPSEIPRRQWLYGGHFIRDFLTTTFAPGAVGKSILLITEAMAMASGKPLLGVAVP